jgi:hypothetical protein
MTVELGCDELVALDAHPAVELGANENQILTAAGEVPIDLVWFPETLDVVSTDPTDVLEVQPGTPEILDGADPDDALIVSAGPPGPQGIPGASIQEVYVQETQPASGPTPWLWAQTDGPPGVGTVEFLKVYQP